MDMGAGSGRRSPPDILVVVLDCVRAQEFPGGWDAAPPMPFVDGLLKESLTFPKAATTAPWTIPAHASLFTGLYPWEHRAHAAADLALRRGFPTLAERLSAAGYATGFFASNGLLSPESGLTQGFQVAAWGEWWERYLRVPRLTYPGAGYGLPLGKGHTDGPLARRVSRQVRLSHRFPVIWDAVNRLAGQVRYRGDGPMISVSSWIEVALERWLSQIDPSRPVFAFVNLMDAHEPYISNPQLVRGLGAWLANLPPRMDWTNLLAGAWSPDQRQSLRYTALYRGMLEIIDRRLRNLVALFDRLDRWDDTVFVLTSDHGQALGEHGYLFHSVEVWEQLMRIPLLVRIPNSHLRGVRAKGWASLVDVAPTLLAIADHPAKPPAERFDLRELADADRPVPLLGMSDGITEKGLLRRIGAADAIGAHSALRVVAYQADQKLVLNVATGASNWYRAGAAESSPILDPLPGEEGAIALARARDIATLLARDAASAVDAKVEDRLRSWGY